MPKLAVILGAGASYDVCPNPEPYQGPITDNSLRPPLIANIFSRRFDETLAKYPPAQSIMSDVRMQLRGNHDATFEQVLRNLSESPNNFTRRQMRFVPLALHDYFDAVSNGYTTEPINYSHLINRTIGQDIQAAFITLNYDMLIEHSLRKITGVEFNSVESYISASEQHWMLIKLHGSVRWGYPWIPVRHEGRVFNEIGAAAGEFEPPKALPGDIATGLSSMLRGQDQLFYPAMALPVAGKYGFVCPPSHVRALKDFVSDCDNYLFIGFSANDADLLDFLADNVKMVRRVRIVAGSVDGLRAVSERLLKGVPQFKGRSYYLEQYHGFGDGFTSYLSGPFADMLRSLFE